MILSVAKASNSSGFAYKKCYLHVIKDKGHEMVEIHLVTKHTNLYIGEPMILS